MPITYKNLPAQSSGYTLVELLVAMVIGLFLLTGAYQVSISNSQANRLQKGIQQTQVNGRFAINNLSYSIKTAGYSGFYGSLSSGVENLLNTPNNQRWDISIPSSGFNNVTAGQNIAGITGFIPNTDVLLLKGINSNSIGVLSNADSSTLVAATDSAYAAGDIVLVSDDSQATLVQVGSVSVSANASTLNIVTGGVSPGNSSLLNNSFNSTAEVGKYDVQMFYIKTGRNGQPSLFKTALVNNAGVVQLQENELASNVSDMQISYGIDTNNDQILDVYRDASAVTDWNQLISINVTLLVNSPDDNLVPAVSSYSYDPATVTFTRDAVATAGADRRLKRVFRTYVPLRNSQL